MFNRLINFSLSKAKAQEFLDMHHEWWQYDRVHATQELTDAIRRLYFRHGKTASDGLTAEWVNTLLNYPPDVATLMINDYIGENVPPLKHFIDDITAEIKKLESLSKTANMMINGDNQSDKRIKQNIVYALINSLPSYLSVRINDESYSKYIKDNHDLSPNNYPYLVCANRNNIKWQTIYKNLVLFYSSPWRNFGIRDAIRCQTRPSIGKFDFKFGETDIGIILREYIAENKAWHEKNNSQIVWGEYTPEQIDLYKRIG